MASQNQMQIGWNIWSQYQGATENTKKRLSFKDSFSPSDEILINGLLCDENQMSCVIFTFDFHLIPFFQFASSKCIHEV